jgi:hypothetical protein
MNGIYVSWMVRDVVATPDHFQGVVVEFQGKNFDGPGIVFAIFGARFVSLQTARKPNSVLDDHSSTRRITAAL